MQSGEHGGQGQRKRKKNKEEGRNVAISLPETQVTFGNMTSDPQEQSVSMCLTVSEEEAMGQTG